MDRLKQRLDWLQSQTNLIIYNTEVSEVIDCNDCTTKTLQKMWHITNMSQQWFQLISPKINEEMQGIEGQLKYTESANLIISFSDSDKSGVFSLKQQLPYNNILIRFNDEGFASISIFVESLKQWKYILHDPDHPPEFTDYENDYHWSLCLKDLAKPVYSWAFIIGDDGSFNEKNIEISLRNEGTQEWFAHDQELKAIIRQPLLNARQAKLKMQASFKSTAKEYTFKICDTQQFMNVNTVKNNVEIGEFKQGVSNWVILQNVINKDFYVYSKNDPYPYLQFTKQSVEIKVDKPKLSSIFQAFIIKDCDIKDTQIKEEDAATNVTNQQMVSINPIASQNTIQKEEVVSKIEEEKQIESEGEKEQKSQQQQHIVNEQPQQQQIQIKEQPQSFQQQDEQRQQEMLFREKQRKEQELLKANLQKQQQQQQQKPVLNQLINVNQPVSNPPPNQVLQNNSNSAPNNVSNNNKNQSPLFLIKTGQFWLYTDGNFINRVDEAKKGSFFTYCFKTVSQQKKTIQLLFNNRPLIKSQELNGNQQQYIKVQESTSQDSPILEFDFDEKLYRFSASEVLLKQGFLVFDPNYYDTLTLQMIPTGQ